MFPLNAILTDDQKRVLDSQPNLIVSGVAGTGKTFLTLFLAEKLTSNHNVAIIVLANSIKYFIEKALTERNIQRTTVYNHNKFIQAPSKYDYIIIDDAIDFSLNQLKLIKEYSDRGVYFLGDNNQRIFKRNYNEPTARMEEIKNKFGCPEIVLRQNTRFHEEINNFICDVYPNLQMEGALEKVGIKPMIEYCESREIEVEKILYFIKDNEFKGSIGLILFDNTEVRNMLYLFHQNGIKNYGYKREEENNLLFTENSINILTYASAKGLEFDCVIIPFLNSNFLFPNDIYVAITRAKKRLILIYSTSFTSRIDFKTGNSFKGIIKKPYLIGEADLHFDVYNYMVEENIKISKKYEQFTEVKLSEIKEKYRPELDKAIKTLIKAGFTQDEAKKYLKKRVKSF